MRAIAVQEEGRISIKRGQAYAGCAHHERIKKVNQSLEQDVGFARRDGSDPYLSGWRWVAGYDHLACILHVAVGRAVIAGAVPTVCIQEHHRQCLSAAATRGSGAEVAAYWGF